MVSLAGYLGLVQVSARDGGKLERGETVTRGESLIDLNTVTADLVEEEDEKSRLLDLNFFMKFYQDRQ